MNIDVHSHFFPIDAFRNANRYRDKAPRFTLEKNGRYSVFCQGGKRGSLASGAYDPQARANDLDQMGIDIQVLSPSPILLYYWDSLDSAAYFSRVQNEGIHAATTVLPERFVAFGTVPLQDVREAIVVAEEAKKLGLKGLEIGTRVGARYLDDVEFEPFYQVAQDLKLLLLIHPIESGDSDKSDPVTGSLSGVLGFPYETTLTIEKMIIKGIFERYQNLRVCLAHGGGFLPYNIWRLDHAFSRRKELRENIVNKPSEYLSRMYFDTLVHSPLALEYLVKVVGSSRVLLGTDYPMGMADTQSVAKVMELTSLDEKDKSNILEKNGLSALQISSD